MLEAIEEFINNAVGVVSGAMAGFIFGGPPIPGTGLPAEEAPRMPIIVLWLIFAAIGFTVYFKFIQVRGFKVSTEVVRGKFSRADDPGEVTHFQALASALSGTVGLGNIAGVALAVTLGGPGATFWMILAGIFGMCTKFVECTLGVKYREIDADGQVNGGPFKYLPVAFSRLPKPVSTLLVGFFAIAILIFGVVGAGMFQANQTYSQFQAVTGGEDSPLDNPAARLVIGLVFALLVAIVVIGGIKSIAKVTSRLVPFMAITYLLACVTVLVVNADAIPAAIAAIVSGAFQPMGVAGGAVGVLIIGVQRSAFSNEAGIGSAAIAHSAVKTRRPVSEGFVALLEPFIDTVVVCTMTALTIIIADTTLYREQRDLVAQGDTADATGVALTSASFETVLPWFPYVLTVAVFLFAFSTMITWSYYGIKAWHFLFGRTRTGDNIFRAVLCFFIVVGCIVSLSAVVDLADSALFACAFVNIIGLIILLPKVKDEMVTYLADRRSGKLYELGAENEQQLAEIRSDHGND